MRFNLAPPETREVVFKHGDSEMRCTVRVVDNGTYMDLVAKHKIGDEDQDQQGFVLEIARTLWVGFEGAVDVNGTAIPNTPEMREAMALHGPRRFPGFLVEAVRNSAEGVQEGNADSGSA